MPKRRRFLPFWPSVRKGSFLKARAAKSDNVLLLLATMKKQFFLLWSHQTRQRETLESPSLSAHSSLVVLWVICDYCSFRKQCGHQMHAKCRLYSTVQLSKVRAHGVKNQCKFQKLGSKTVKAISRPDPWSGVTSDHFTAMAQIWKYTLWLHIHVHRLI